MGEREREVCCYREEAVGWDGGLEAGDGVIICLDWHEPSNVGLCDISGIDGVFASWDSFSYARTRCRMSGEPTRGNHGFSAPVIAAEEDIAMNHRAHQRKHRDRLVKTIISVGIHSNTTASNVS